MNNNNNNKAFSLIELSIVLIIIGLLVAGITGGKSLIDSARVRTLINEFRYYEQSLYSFKLIKDRLPGDLNGSGRIGQGSGQYYDKFSFPEPYNENKGFYGIADQTTAPFIDLYLAKVIGFEPKKPRSSTYTLTSTHGGVPKSKIGFGLILFSYVRPFSMSDGSMFTDSCENKKNALCGAAGNTIRLEFNGNAGYDDIPSEFAKKLDLKIDDGKYNSGVVRGLCDASNGTLPLYTSYESATNCMSVLRTLKLY